MYASNRHLGKQTDVAAAVRSGALPRGVAGLSCAELMS